MQAQQSESVDVKRINESAENNNDDIGKNTPKLDENQTNEEVQHEIEI